MTFRIYYLSLFMKKTLIH